MKKWLMLLFLVIAVSTFISSFVISSFVFRSLNDPLFCANCHAAEYKNYTMPINSDLPVHKEKGITCIECHSAPGIESSLTTKKLLIKAQLVNYSLPAINRLLSANFTLNTSLNASDFSILKANCTKCHDVKKIKSIKFNHSNASNCEKCHLVHMEYKKPEVSFLRRMGEGGHRNLTCGDCHGTEVTRFEELPQCTKCHTPHLKGAQWDRSVCLGCHSDPHLPVKNAVFKGIPTKVMCAACHNNIYQVLTVYDSRHNKLPSCTSCHPKHRETFSCVTNCHVPHGPSHSGSTCYGSCHGYVRSCKDCHTNPHAPLSGLPIIVGGEQWAEYAKQAGKK